MTCRSPLLAVVLLSGCYVATDGLIVDLATRVPLDGLTVDETTPLVTSDLGIAWSLDDGNLRLAQAALVGCDGDAATADLVAEPVSLRDVDADVHVGTIAPSPGDWCAIEIVSAPVREWGAEVVPTAWALELTEVEGPHRAVQSTDTHVLTLALDTPMVLDRRHRDATLIVELPVGRWLDGIPAAATDDELRAGVLRQLAQTARVELE